VLPAPKTRDISRHGEAGLSPTPVLEGQEIPVDRHLEPVMTEPAPAPTAARHDAGPGVRPRALRSIDDEQGRIRLRPLVGRGHHDVVDVPAPVELPRCLEELEELPDHASLLGPDHDTYHGTSTPRHRRWLAGRSGGVVEELADGADDVAGLLVRQLGVNGQCEGLSRGPF